MSLTSTISLSAKRLLGRKLFWVFLAISVIAGLIAVLWVHSNNSGKNYSVVYLTSNEIYVGRFYTFPHPRLEGGYILQNVKSASDQAKTDLQLFPLAETVWSPTKLYLNWDHIIYYGPLNENSVAAKGIKSKLQAK